MKKLNYLGCLKACLIASFALFAVNLHSQMSGAYTINSGSPPSGSNFTTFTSAAAALKTNGVSGPVTFTVVANSGPYLEQVKIDAIPGTSAVNTVTFNGNGNKIISIPTSTNLYMIRLNGASYVTLNNLILHDSSDTYGWGVHITGGASYNTINACTIDLTKTNSTSSTATMGIIASSSNTSPSASGVSGSYNTISNNTIKGGVNAGVYYAIRINGNTGTVGCSGNQILNNTILDGYSYQIYLYYADNTLVEGNDISRPYKVTVSSFYGIYLSTGSFSNTIRKNRIHNTHDAASSLTGTVGCLYFSSADAAVGMENLVYNNLIYNINGNGTTYGIYNSGSDGALYYYNTISLDYTASTAGSTYGFYQTTAASGIEFKNNNISITRGGSGVKYACYWITSTSLINSDRNNLYVNSAGSGAQNVGYWSATAYPTLANWQTANSNSFDQNSTSTDPIYVNAPGGNFKPGSAGMNNIGTPIAGISTDINNVTRNAITPDAGAYEFTPPADDAGLIGFVSPVSPCPGTANVSVTLKNFGAVTLDSVRIHWTVNSVSQPTVFYTVPLATGSDTVVSLGSFTVASGVPYNILAWTSNPNGGTDANMSNDSSSIIGLKSAMSGTYTVGTSGDYPNVVAAVEDLNNRGLCGAVTIDVNPLSGPYNGALNFGPINGASATNTITVLGHGAVVTDTTDATRYYLVLLNGTNYLTLDSLNIVNKGATYGIGVLLTNTADHNTIQNCTIDLSSTGSNTTVCGILSSASLTSTASYGDNANYNTFVNNTIEGGVNAGVYYGIRLNGLSTGKGNWGNKIINNTIHDGYFYNIYSIYGDNLLIDGNDISRPTKVTVSTFYGIYLSTGNINTVIRNNRIHNTHDNASSKTGSVYGIYTTTDATSGQENKIYNNLIYNINSDGTIYGLYNSGSDYVSYYYNTISLDNTGSTAGSTYGFYQTTAASGIEFKNNNISITRGGSGTKYVCYWSTNTSLISSDRNNLYVNSLGSGAQYVGYWNATTYASLANWQTANTNAFDQNSASSDPLYVNAAGGNLKPASASMNNIGTPISGITTDIDNVTRDVVTPDPGAYEFTPPADDAGVMGFVSPVAPCPGTAIVSVTLKNYGAVTLDSVRINWTINSVSQPTVYYTNSIASGNDTLVTLGNFTVVAGLQYNIVAWTSKPNGGIDANPSNDSSSLVGLKSAMSGTYTVGTSGDYLTMVAAVDDLNNRGICGAVTIDVDPLSGPYTGALPFGAIDGTSATNTITVLGHGAVITDTTDAGRYYLVLLNGTDYLTLDSLNIVNRGATYGIGVLLTNTADHNTVRNCYIDMSSVTGSNTTVCGILSSASMTSTASYGDNANYNNFENNTIEGGNNGLYYAIRLNGLSTGKGNWGNKILNNTILNAYYYNIYSIYGDYLLIDGNDISRANKANVSTFYGIYLSTGNTNAVVSKNRIHNTHDVATTKTGSVYGIYCSADATSGNENLIYNNMVYNLNTEGTIYCVYNSGADFTEYYYNTISLDYVNSTSTSTTYAFYQPSAAANVVLKNNIISVTRGGTGTKYGLYFSSTSTNQVSDNNVVYMNALGTVNHGYWGGAVSTFSAWQAVNSGAFDQNSDSASPEFISIAADDYKPNSMQINDIGTPIAGITNDIMGMTRNLLTPDAGAIEYTPIPTNDSCSSAIQVVAGVYSGTTLGATMDFAPTCVVADDSSGGVWYKLDLGYNYTVASLCGSNFDTRMRVFAGSCANLQCADGNEDYCGSQSQVSGCADSNMTVYILVYGNNGAEGNFTMTISETPRQAASISVTGNTTFCEGDSVLLMANSSGSYVWNDSAMSTGQILSVFEDGSYRVITTDTNGCSDTSAFVNTTKLDVTQAVITPNGPTSFCDGESVTLESNSSNAYLWNDNSMSTTQSIVVSTAGSFTVTTTDTNGCESTSAPITTVVFPLPSIDLGMDTTICVDAVLTLDAGSGFNSYNWSTGETTQTINFSKGTTGVYTITSTVTDGNGCEGSDQIVVTVDVCGGIEDVANNASLEVYPIPARSEINLIMKGFVETSAQVNISNVKGQVVHTLSVPTGEKQTIDVGNLTSGIYFMSVVSGSQSALIKLVIQ